MISDLFLIPCWSRKYLDRLPQYMGHNHRGFINSMDLAPNRQVFTIFVMSLTAVNICGKQKNCNVNKRNFLCVDLIFAQKLHSHHAEDGTTRLAPNSNCCLAIRVNRAARNPSRLLTIFPIKQGVNFLTGLASSVLYSMKLQLGIFVISIDNGAGQSTSKFPLVTLVYRKNWTIVCAKCSQNWIYSMCKGFFVQGIVLFMVY